MWAKNLYRRVQLFLKKTAGKKVRYIIFIALFIVMSFVLLLTGHFLLSDANHNYSENGWSSFLRGIFSGFSDKHAQAPEKSSQESEPAEEPEGPYANPVKYTHRSEYVNGVKQEINILEMEPSAEGLRIRPVLSHDLIYGFELLSEMAARKKAYAAINGGFFHEYGLPSGMVMIDGELISASTGRYPVFIVEKGKASLKEINSAITVVVENGGGQIQIDRLNSPAGAGDTAVYTPVYGLSNRADKANYSVSVENGVVTKVAYSRSETEIPQNGMVISFFDPEKYDSDTIPLKVGDAIRLSHLPTLDAHADAYECGSWLVRAGKPVVAAKDAWVGVMTNRDPRTAVGIKADGTVILLTVDGRQPGYSAGFTGQELAEYLISCGAEDAAMLDGGASTEMIVEGKLVSRPSYKGEERPLAGGILVLTGK